MITALKSNIFTIIALAVLASFVAVWGYIVVEVATFEPTTAVPDLELATGIVSLAGLLGTTVATITASALGFTIADVKSDSNTLEFTARVVGQQISTPTLFAILAYLLVSVGAFITWVLNEAVSPEVLSVYAISSVGWLVGSASVAFKTTEN